MLTGEVRPTTLDGVKRLAAQFRKEQGIKHSLALDLAAKAADCRDFRNARRTLPARSTKPARPYVLLTIYWYDRDPRHRVGRETLRVELSKPLLEICGKHALRSVRGFGGMRMVADDHFVADSVAPRQDHARDLLLIAERSLRFMDHTGLRPSREHRKAFPKGKFKDRLPGKDHSTDWFDPASGQFILIDEPYRGVPNEDERAAWAARHGWHVVKTSSPGMYRPHVCDLYVATETGGGYDLDGLVSKIEAMPAPRTDENWEGESSPSWETFTSPMAKTPQDVRRARCRGTIFPASSATTLPYSYSFGSSHRRPAGALGIAGHVEAGRIIKAALQSDHRSPGAYRRLNGLRSTLEDWLHLEIGRGELGDREFLDVYYHDLEGGDPLQEIRLPTDAIGLLDGLRGRLQAAYPDCEPLRQQLRRIEMSMRLMRG
jgi:hypothetical protein